MQNSIILDLVIESDESLINLQKKTKNFNYLSVENKITLKMTYCLRKSIKNFRICCKNQNLKLLKNV